MKRVLIVLMFGTPALAQTHQVSISPFVGYSNFNGFSIGAGARYAYSLTSHLQWESGVGFVTESRGSSNSGSRYSLTTGLNYNFSEDLGRSFYVGAGIGYSDMSEFNVRDPYRTYGFVRAGKRIAMNKSGSMSWSPELVVSSRGKGAAGVGFNLLQFSFSF